MLTRILADNFRALVSFELRPGRLSLLLGENGSGKTSLLEVLGNLRDLIVLGRLAAELFAGTKTKWETRSIQRFELDFEEGDGTYRYALEIQAPRETHEQPFIRSEQVSFNGEPLYRFSDGEVHLYYDDGSANPVFPFSAERSFLTNLEAGRGHRLGRLVAFKALVEGIWIIQPNPFEMDLFSKQDWPFLARRGFNFAALRSPASRTSVLRGLVLMRSSFWRCSTTERTRASSIWQSSLRASVSSSCCMPPF
jgi:hypothetical protein